MKRFLLQLAAFLLLVLLLFVWLLCRAGGNTDDHYRKFTSAPPANLIIGTSKASQGLRPSVLKEVLGTDFFNYAFTLSHSPYGPLYFESIKRKLKPGTTNGTFILAVDPWSVSTVSSTPNNPEKFYEVQHCLADMRFVNLNPNPFYLWKHYPYQLYELAFGRESEVYAHTNGWLEVTVPMHEGAIEWRLKRKIASYANEKRPLYNYSSLRLQYLRETIEWLSERGNVFLVQLPVHDQIYQIGDDLVPQFDSLMQALEPITAGYYNMAADSTGYQFIDGNHIYKESSGLASQRVAEFVGRQSKGQIRGQ